MRCSSCVDCVLCCHGWTVGEGGAVAGSGVNMILLLVKHLLTGSGMPALCISACSGWPGVLKHGPGVGIYVDGHRMLCGVWQGPLLHVAHARVITPKACDSSTDV